MYDAGTWPRPSAASYSLPAKYGGEVTTSATDASGNSFMLLLSPTMSGSSSSISPAIASRSTPPVHGSGRRTRWRRGSRAGRPRTCWWRWGAGAPVARASGGRAYEARRTLARWATRPRSHTVCPTARRLEQRPSGRRPSGPAIRVRDRRVRCVVRRARTRRRNGRTGTDRHVGDDVRRLRAVRGGRRPGLRRRGRHRRRGGHSPEPPVRADGRFRRAGASRRVVAALGRRPAGRRRVVGRRATRAGRGRSGCAAGRGRRALRRMVRRHGSRRGRRRRAWPPGDPRPRRRVSRPVPRAAGAAAPVGEREGGRGDRRRDRARADPDHRTWHTDRGGVGGVPVEPADRGT